MAEGHKNGARKRRQLMTVKIPAKTEQPINNPSRAASIFRAILRAECPVDQDKEHFWVMGLTTRKTIKYIELVSLGTLKTAPVSPREVFRFAIMQGVDSIIVCHNHPSGDLAPSFDDVAISNKLIDAGRILGIEMLDHVIIAGNSDTSVINRGNTIGPRLIRLEGEVQFIKRFTARRAATKRPLVRRGATNGGVLLEDPGN
jgi:DNA repair protein RadC